MSRGWGLVICKRADTDENVELGPSVDLLQPLTHFDVHQWCTVDIVDCKNNGRSISDVTHWFVDCHFRDCILARVQFAGGDAWDFPLSGLHIPASAE